MALNMLLKDISFIIPVFNRPDEINELLNSFSKLDGDKNFEIVIVEDGSTNKCDKIIKQKYYKKYLLFTKNKKTV